MSFWIRVWVEHVLRCWLKCSTLSTMREILKWIFHSVQSVGANVTSSIWAFYNDHFLNLLFFRIIILLLLSDWQNILLKISGLWGVINNAGLLTKVGVPDWLTVDDFKGECDVNLWGLIDVTLTFLPLVKRERGRLVNMASMMGRISIATALPYSISKYGIEAFTDGIRYGSVGIALRLLVIIISFSPQVEYPCSKG